MRARSVGPCARSTSRSTPNALAGEAASLAARAERARRELTEVAVERLEALGLLAPLDEAAVRAELRELEGAIEAVEELQSWVDSELEAATAA